MSNPVPCRKCGHPIIFVKRVFNGKEKFVPTNPDYSDHWDICKGVVRTLEWARREMAKPENRPGITHHNSVTHVHCGELPPWDESLGDFRRFTASEIEEGLVCVGVNKRG
jgi:hypothetical protein